MKQVMLAMGITLALGGCGHTVGEGRGIDCWTRADYETAKRMAEDPAREIKAGCTLGS